MRRVSEKLRFSTTLAERIKVLLLLISVADGVLGSEPVSLAFSPSSAFLRLVVYTNSLKCFSSLFGV